MKFYKILFFNTLMISIFITISSNSWMGMWFGLEINLLSIIPLMNSKNILSNEASLKYFITQAMASTIILFSIIMMSYNLFSMNYQFILMMNSALLMKLGAAPFHFWFPQVMEGLNWMNCLILMTMQKISPMIIIMYNLNYTMFFSFIIIISMIISGIMGLNQISMRKILAFSSINHIGWMIASIFYSETNWTYYFSVYSIISINIILMLKLLNIYYLKQLFNSMNSNFLLKFIYIFNFLSLGGIPPFLGFLPKWFVIENLLIMKFQFLAFFMIMFTLLTLFFYMRLSFAILIMNIQLINYKINPNYNNFMIYTLNLVSLISIMFIFILYNFI
uniref:NADH-ubiquinone oxidoreductase chain 2 n=1 Tax=Staphylinidae sp. BMNH 1274207 TaxID=1796558 RepID=A0A140EGT6_9COLE|nr:NADH dehydrogenase subunit 2 [Staphylinidae sp. BMNH 1274207]